jgi:NAD(P)H dehydrogenase (quinone)
MYTIMGATGKVGGATANALLNAGQRLRVVVRDRAKGESWASRGCELAIGDLGDVDALAKAFEGAEAAFVMLPPTFDPSPDFREAMAMIASLRAALEKTPPRRVVALSTIGAESDRPNLLNQLGLMERALSTLAVPVTFLRAAWFMDNAALDVAAARDAGMIDSYLQPLDRAVPMISTEDVGQTAATLLTEEWHGVRVVELEAARRVSPNDIAAAFSKALGKPVKARAVPRGEWEAIFRRVGMTNPMPRRQMVDGFNEGWIDFPRQGAGARKGLVGIDEAIAGLVRG